MKCDFCGKIRARNFMAPLNVYGIQFMICNRCSEEQARDYVIDPSTGRIRQHIRNYLECRLGKDLEENA